MLAVVVGLSTALVFGAADFLGGMAAQRIAAVRVTALSAATGFVILLVLYPVLGGEWSTSAVVLGAISGVTAALAIFLLYASLAIGPMSILSPLTAVISAIVPLSVALIRGAELGTFGFVAIGLALIAVVLVGFVPEKGAVRPSLRGLLMAIGSGAMLGLFLIIFDLTPEDSGIVPLIVNSGVSAVILFSVIGVLAIRARHRDAPRGTWRPAIVLAMTCGVLGVTANSGVLLGLRLGELSTVAVLTALYPAGTILLAALVLRERVAPVQYLGLALAIGAAAMLALA